MKAFASVLLFLCLTLATQLSAQATLSVQGTIQKSFGAAVDDGEYSLTFKLYTVASGGSPVWTETQDGINVIGGVYSALLGEVEPLTAAFDQTYYLGISVDGGAELTPRARLTSSPYALSLIGQSNVFPSTGAVGAGTATPTAGNELHVKDAAADAKVTVEGATTSKVVVASTDGSEIEFVKGGNSASITYNGTNISIEGLNIVFSDDINLPANKTIKYNGIADWRLIDIDDFEVDNEGWVHRSDIGTNASTGTLVRYGYHTGAVNSGHALAIADGQSGASTMKKVINLTGIPHTMVKVKLVLHPTSSPSQEYIFAGFAPALNSPPADHEWAFQRTYDLGWSVQGNVFNHFSHRGAFFSDNLELTTSHTGDSLVLVVAGQFDEGSANESFTIDNVEIYVR